MLLMKLEEKTPCTAHNAQRGLRAKRTVVGLLRAPMEPQSPPPLSAVRRAQVSTVQQQEARADDPCWPPPPGTALSCLPVSDPPSCTLFSPSQPM